MTSQLCPTLLYYIPQLYFVYNHLIYIATQPNKSGSVNEASVRNNTRVTHPSATPSAARQLTRRPHPHEGI